MVENWPGSILRELDHHGAHADSRVTGQQHQQVERARNDRRAGLHYIGGEGVEIGGLRVATAAGSTQGAPAAGHAPRASACAQGHSYEHVGVYSPGEGSTQGAPELGGVKGRGSTQGAPRPGENLRRVSAAGNTHIVEDSERAGSDVAPKVHTACTGVGSTQGAPALYGEGMAMGHSNHRMSYPQPQTAGGDVKRRAVANPYGHRFGLACGSPDAGGGQAGTHEPAGSPLVADKPAADAFRCLRRQLSPPRLLAPGTGDGYTPRPGHNGVSYHQLDRVNGQRSGRTWVSPGAVGGQAGALEPAGPSPVAGDTPRPLMPGVAVIHTSDTYQQKPHLDDHPVFAVHRYQSVPPDEPRSRVSPPTLGPGWQPSKLPPSLQEMPLVGLGPGSRKIGQLTATGMDAPRSVCSEVKIPSSEMPLADRMVNTGDKLPDNSSPTG